MIIVFIYTLFCLLVIYFLIREKLPRVHSIISIQIIDQLLNRLDLLLVNTKEPKESELVSKRTEIYLNPKAKGDAFENFIIDRISSNYFEFLDWRSDKKRGNKYPLSSHNPDFELRFKPAKKDFRFAIECKYRSSYDQDGNIVISENYRQIRNYKRYAYERKQKVFVAIGMEGTAHMPKDVYIIPISEITKTIVSRETVEQFKRKNPYSYLYFDYSKKTLN